MTSPSSSTSSFRPLLWLLCFLGLSVALVGSAGFFNYLAYKNGWLDFAFIELYRYQVQKLRSGKVVPDDLFVGDSALGNAISAAHWSQLTGRSALNLALTGSYGYAGSLNMLKKQLRIGRPKRVFIVHTADMMTRGSSDIGYLHTSDGGLAEVPIRALITAYVNLNITRNALSRFLGREARRSPDFLADDYVRQGGRLEESHLRQYREAAYSPSSIRPESAFYLRKIGETCLANGLSCFYVHGPLFRSFCQGSDAYFEKVNGMVEAAGIKLAMRRPVCIPEEDLGDALDHIAPESKKAYTERYYQLLRPILSPR